MAAAKLPELPSTESIRLDKAIHLVDDRQEHIATIEIG